MTEHKTMQFANFNITFGDEKNTLPMLTYFKEIIYPTFKNGYIKGKAKETKFYFSEVKVKELQGEYVLVGNLIKDTHYEVKTKIENNKLINSPAVIPTAPYSRFMIFLKNHRMIILKNERNSPDIISFRSTFRKFIFKALREYNKKLKKEDRILAPQINIEGKAFKGAIDDAIAKFQKVKRLIVRVYPLNNDFDTFEIIPKLRDTMDNLQSQTSNITINSPNSLEGVKNVFVKSDAKMSVTAIGFDVNGFDLKLKNDDLATKSNIIYEGNLVAEKDDVILSLAYQHAGDMLNEVSSDNEALYDDFKDNFSLEEFM